MGNYIAIAEPSEDGETWWISFPGLPGITSAAEGPRQIVAQAQGALASALAAGAQLPPSIEQGLIPAYDLEEYDSALVVLVPFVLSVPAAAQ